MDNASYEELLALQERMGGNVKCGATKDQLANLPSFRVPKLPKAPKGKGKKLARAAEEEVRATRPRW